MVEILRDRLKREIIKESYTPYRNIWFLVRKKDGKYRLINLAIKLNVVTIRDIMIPPNADEYIADLTIGQRVILLDIFSGYD